MPFRIIEYGLPLLYIIPSFADIFTSIAKIISPLTMLFSIHPFTF